MTILNLLRREAANLRFGFTLELAGIHAHHAATLAKRAESHEHSVAIFVGGM